MNSRIEAVLKEPKRVELEEVLGYDLILIDSPNHIGRPTRGIKMLLDKLGEIGLEEKVGSVFDTHMGGEFNKAAGKMAKRKNYSRPVSDNFWSVSKGRRI